MMTEKKSHRETRQPLQSARQSWNQCDDLEVEEELMNEEDKKTAEDAEKIAAAAGIPVSRAFQSTLLYRYQDRDPWDIFDPQGDLNDAFEAAEKTGLFNEWSLSRDCDGWTFVDCNDCCNRWIGFHSASPALAICAAILRLRENQ